MRGARARQAWSIAAGLGLVCVLLLALAKNALAGWIFAAIAGSSTGTLVAIGGANIGLDHASLSNISISARSGEPIAHVDRVEMRYDLHDLVTRSGRLFGLESLDVTRPQITIVHHADGSYNIPIPKSQAPSNGGLPLILRGSVTGGTMTGIEQQPHGGPPLSVTGIHARFDLNTAAASRYSAGLVYHESGRSYPIAGTGTLDARAGYAMHRWSVPAMPIARLVNFAIGNPNLQLAAGSITGSSVRAFALAGVTGIVASTFVHGVVLASPALAEPVRDLHARLDVSSQGAILEGVDGSLDGIPIHGSGGIYDLSNPSLRFALVARGDLAVLRKAVVQARRLPIAGTTQLRVLAEGTLVSPLVTISVTSPEIRYLHAPIRNVSGLAALAGNELDAIDASASYAGFSLDARGRIALASRPNGIELLAHAHAPANRVPYASDLVPGMPLDGELLATAGDPKLFSTHGVITGQSFEQRLGAIFDVNSAGAGTVGPLVTSGRRGALFGDIALDHPAGDHAAFLIARNVHITPANVPPLPGFPVPSLPALSGTLNARVLGTLDRGQAAALGTGRVHATLAGGTVDAPFALLYAANHGIVQSDGARFRGVKIEGVRLGAASATVAIEPHALSVLAANVRGGNASAIAGGTLAANDRIAISADAIPVMGGSVSAAALVRASLASPALSTTVLARNITYDRVPLSAIAALHYRDGRLSIADAAIGADPASVTVSGTVSGLNLGRQIQPRYDLDAQLHAADVHALAAIAQPTRAQLIAGSIEGRVHVAGSGTSPSVRGSLRMPEGSINGLAFTNLDGTVDATPQRIAVSRGAVTVGTTALAFHAGTSAGQGITAGVDAPHANLADFDDFFNSGDALAGRGSFAADVAYAPGSIASSGNARFTAMRYERLEVGNAKAAWSTAGGSLALSLYAGGRNGLLQTSGTIATRTHAVNLTMHAQQVNLSSWLPALGISEPVTGDLDASGTAEGTFPNVDATLAARVTNGTVAAYKLEKATLALHTAQGVGRIDSAVIEIPYFAASASGTFGFHPDDALAIVAKLQSSDIAALARETTGKPNNYGGSFAATLNVNGTLRVPLVDANAQVSALRYGSFSVPRILARASLNERTLTLDSAEADLQRGRLLLAGRLPLRRSPLGVAQNAPISATMTADDLELSDVAALLPSGTHLAGRIDGTLRASGPLDDPSLHGLLTLAQASYSGPQETTPLAGTAQLSFSGHVVRLQNTRFSAGGGTLTAYGTADVPSLSAPSRVALQLHAGANAVTLDLPNYYRGRVDGSIALARMPDQDPILAGTVTLSSARLPITAFLSGSGSSSASPALELGFDDFTIAVGNDVRVQSANVDVGARGQMTLNGTLADLRPSGSFESTGGTLSFYRNFTLDRASVDFSPQSGIIPDIHAVATTYITDPNTEIRLHVTGPATGMNLGLSSNPAYNRSQILGLLVGAQQFGAVQGVASTGTGSFSAGGAATSMATGQLNTVFTRSLLEPLGTALQSTLGFANVQLTSDIGQGQYGAQFVKAFGRNVHGIFNESVGYPQRTSFTLAMTPNPYSALRLMTYTQPDATLFPLSQPPSIPPPGTAGEAAQFQLLQLSGTNGFGLTYERRYW